MGAAFSFLWANERTWIAERTIASSPPPAVGHPHTMRLSFFLLLCASLLLPVGSTDCCANETGTLCCANYSANPCCERAVPVDKALLEDEELRLATEALAASMSEIDGDGEGVSAATDSVSEAEPAGLIAGGTSAVVHLALTIFFGSCGVGRCYRGQICLGTLQAMSLGGFLVWTMIDIIFASTSMYDASLTWDFPDVWRGTMGDTMPTVIAAP